MSEACIVGWAHSPFGKLDDPDVEALIGRVARAAIDDAGIAPADVEAGFVSLFNNGFSAQDFPPRWCCSMCRSCATGRSPGTRTRVRPARRRCMARAISSPRGAGGSRW